MEGYASMTSNQLTVSASSAVLRARAIAMPETNSQKSMPYCIDHTKSLYRGCLNYVTHSLLGAHETLPLRCEDGLFGVANLLDLLRERRASKV